MFNLNTLIFKEDDKVRLFSSSDFNFVLEKDKKFSICYGSNSEETPSYDPLSPQDIDLYLNDDYNFDFRFQLINNLFNIKKEDDGQLISISTISNVSIFVPNIYMKNIDEVIKLVQYLDSFGFNVSLNIKYDQVNEMSDIFRLTTFKWNEIIFDVEDFNATSLLNNLNLILSKNIKVSYNFTITLNNCEEFCKLLDMNFPKNTFSNIIFKNPITKKIKDKIVNKIKGNYIFTICDTKTVKNSKLDYDLVKKYQDGLFKCYIDLDKNEVSYSPNKKGISFSEIENINSYWNSDLFVEHRNLLVKNKYE